MSRDLHALVAALRAPLVHGQKLPDLGPRLRAACDSLVSAGALPPERMGPMRAWRQKLSTFEKLPRDDQDVEVARGLRLCATLAPGAGVAPLVAVPPPEASEALRSLPGIGAAFARRLAERDLQTLEDLAWFLPRGYLDLRRVIPLRDAVAAGAGRATFVAQVEKVRWAGSWGRRRFLQVHLIDGDVRLTARWFNIRGGSMGRRFEPAMRVVLSGVVRPRDGELEIANPEILGAEHDDATAARAQIQPRYLDVEGVPAAILRRACRAAAARVTLDDGVPAETVRRLELGDLAQALGALHAPPGDLSDDDVAALNRAESRWHERLAFGELFLLALAVTRRRVERDQLSAPACRAAPRALEEAERIFPFALTGAQRRAISSISSALERERPMNRLLQGDVGAGKTAVAFAAAHAVMSAGRQVAVMAPTELLAEQHLATLGPWARALGRRVALLTASTPRGARESTLGMLSSGAIDLLVGTHALLAERVDFSDLGLVIIDEQHRFGVAQRVRLRVGGREPQGALPHLLVMTATPIPRSLALTIYGDLDVTLLDEMPAGREPPRTRVLSGGRGRMAAYKHVARVVDDGGRAFVVCPLVAPSEDSPEWTDATTTAERLTVELAPRRVGLAHGRMSSAERDAAMARLRSGEIDVLVATTIIEVGVDVPAARVMVVEDADRFGLAQLHQLRGRVGRGGGESSCFLLTRGARTSDAARRLAIMEETCDGFRIAEEDLAIRGPGEILGLRQAGLPRLRFADIVKHAALAAEARREAERVLAGDPELARPEHAGAARALAARLAEDAVTAEGG